MLSPSKRIFDDDDKQTDDESTDYEIKNKKISNLITKYVENTPTPMINRKFNNIRHQNNNENNKILNQNNSARNVIPNTPAFFNSNQTLEGAKRKKKLLNQNNHLLDEDNLPGDDDDEKNQEQVSEKQQLIPIPVGIKHCSSDVRKGTKKSLASKVSSLFKPKLNHTNNKENHSNSISGADESYDTLQKRQRQKNRLVVRKSEVYKHLSPERINDSLAKSKQTLAYEQKIIITDESNETPSISVFDKTTSNNQNAANRIFNSTQMNASKDIQPNFSTNTPLSKNKSSSFPVKFINKDSSINIQKLCSPTVNDQTSFTRITHRITSTTNLNNNDTETVLNSFNEIREKVDTSLFSNIQSDPENGTKSANSSDINHQTVGEMLNEEELNAILFDGLNLNSARRMTNSHEESAEKKQLKCSKKLEMNKNPGGLTDKTNTFVRKNSTGMLWKNSKEAADKIVDQKQIKRKWKFAFLNLDKADLSEFERRSKQLEKQSIKNHKNEIVKVKLQTKFGLETTHLVVDFNKAFDDDNLNLKICQRFLLVLAAFKNCKIIRKEYAVNCFSKKRWLSSDKFLLDSFLNEEDFEELEDAAIHKRHDKFDLRLFNLIRRISEFSFGTKMFGTFKNVYILDDDNSDKLDETFGFRKDYVYDYLRHLFILCGGNETSRIKSAELIIAVDTQVYSTNRTNFCERFGENSLRTICRQVRKKDGMKIVSSNWVLDSILDNCLWDIDDYLIDTIFPCKN